MRKTLAAAAVIVFATIGAANAQQTFKISCFCPAPDPTWKDVIQPWIDQVTKEGAGVIKMEGYAGGTLQKNPALQVKIVQDGVAEGAWVVPAYTPGRFPDVDVMELPGVIHNVKESSIAVYRLYKKGLFRGFDEFYVPLMTTTHPYSIHTNFPVNQIEDLKGKKLRAGGPVAGNAVKALGAVPVGMPVTDIAESISRGVLDGTAAEWNVMNAFRIIDVAKHHYMAPIGTVPLSVLISKKAYDGLPAKGRELLDRTSGEVLSRKFGDVHLKIQDVKLEETKKMAGHSIVAPDAAATKKWDATMKPVIDEFVKTHPNGQKLYDALVTELKAIRAGM